MMDVTELVPVAHIRKGFVLSIVWDAKQPPNNTSNPDEWMPVYHPSVFEDLAAKRDAMAQRLSELEAFARESSEDDPVRNPADHYPVGAGSGGAKNRSEGAGVDVVDIVADALGRAEIGYSYELVRLVDGIRTYRVKIGDISKEFSDDDPEDNCFDASERAYAFIGAYRRRQQAREIIAALAAKTEAASGARTDLPMEQTTD